jgi:hypothetical protein
MTGALEVLTFEVLLGQSNTTGAANLKFLPVLLQAHHRNFKFKAALETDIC